MARPRQKPIKPSLSAIYTNHLIKRGVVVTLEQHAEHMADQIATLQSLLRQARLENARYEVLLAKVVGEYAA